MLQGIASVGRGRCRGEGEGVRGEGGGMLRPPSWAGWAVFGRNRTQLPDFSGDKSTSSEDSAGTRVQSMRLVLGWSWSWSWSWRGLAPEFKLMKTVGVNPSPQLTILVPDLPRQGAETPVPCRESCALSQVSPKQRRVVVAFSVCAWAYCAMPRHATPRHARPGNDL